MSVEIETKSSTSANDSTASPARKKRKLTTETVADLGGALASSYEVQKPKAGKVLPRQSSEEHESQPGYRERSNSGKDELKRKLEESASEPDPSHVLSARSSCPETPSISKNTLSKGHQPVNGSEKHISVSPSASFTSLPPLGKPSPSHRDPGALAAKIRQSSLSTAPVVVNGKSTSPPATRHPSSTTIASKTIKPIFRKHSKDKGKDKALSTSTGGDLESLAKKSTTSTSSHGPILSPRSLARLAQFDEEMRLIEAEEEAEQRRKSKVPSPDPVVATPPSPKRPLFLPGSPQPAFGDDELLSDHGEMKQPVPGGSKPNSKSRETVAKDVPPLLRAKLRARHASSRPISPPVQPQKKTRQMGWEEVPETEESQSQSQEKVKEPPQPQPRPESPSLSQFEPEVPIPVPEPPPQPEPSRLDLARQRQQRATGSKGMFGLFNLVGLGAGNSRRNGTKDSTWTMFRAPSAGDAEMEKVDEDRATDLDEGTRDGHVRFVAIKTPSKFSAPLNEGEIRDPVSPTLKPSRPDSVIKKMRPKPSRIQTNGKTNGEKLVNGKPLQFLPIGTPSKFAGLLPPARGKGDGEDDVEDFSSPIRAPGEEPRRKRSTALEDTEREEAEHAQVVERGTEMAEAARRERIAKEGQRKVTKKKNLIEVLLAGSTKGKERESSELDEDVLIQMEKSYVNLDGGEHERERSAARMLRKEEEESTQDLLTDMEVDEPSRAPSKVPNEVDDQDSDVSDVRWFLVFCERCD